MLKLLNMLLSLLPCAKAHGFLFALSSPPHVKKAAPSAALRVKLL